MTREGSSRKRQSSYGRLQLARAFETCYNGHKLFYAMRACMSGADCCKTVFGKFSPQAGIVRQCAQVLRHLRSIRRDEIIPALMKQIFARLPRRSDKRNAAGQRFKDADGRNAP